MDLSLATTTFMQYLSFLLLILFRYQKKVYNIIDDVLEWSPKLALSGMMEKQPPLANGTETNFTKGENQSADPEDLVHGTLDNDGQEADRDS